MPERREKFLNGQMYHVYNKTIDNNRFLSETHNADLFCDTLQYYCSEAVRYRFSTFLKLPEDSYKSEYRQELVKPRYMLAELLAYCILPNHFHLLLKQKKSGGIQTLIGNAINSITRYYNINNERVGPLFLPRFKAKRIHTKEYLIHCSRYIHLNPYVAHIIENTSNLSSYEYSSFRQYLTPYFKGKLKIHTKNILAEFNYNRREYKAFVINHATYQRTLKMVESFGND